MRTKTEPGCIGENGASVPFTFDCAGQGKALCRARFALLLVVFGALMVCCFPIVMAQWLGKQCAKPQRWRRGR